MGEAQSKKAKSDTGELICSAFSALLAAVRDVSVVSICRLVRAARYLPMPLRQSQCATE